MNPFWRKPQVGASERQAPGSQEEEPVASVVGERGISSVNRPASLQSRLSNILAVALMSTLGVGFLGWYYAHVLVNRRAATTASRGASQHPAQGEMSLPPLGRVDQPPTGQGTTPLERALGPAPVAPSGFDATGQPPGSPNTYAAATVPTKSPEQLALERRLAGPVFAGPEAQSQLPLAQDPQTVATRSAPRAGPEPAGGAGELSALLRPSVAQAVDAQVLATQRLLLPKGAFLDCTLETAIDSTLPGMTTCVLATDTFSADGSVVLLERGTKLVGETRGQVQQGSSRVFVLWSEARTPTGVIVPLSSPGADELGRSGLPGEVDRHFWQRFGAAILVSVIEGGIQAGVQSRSVSGGTTIYNPSTTTDVMTEVLKSAIAIPPTVTKANGDRIQVLVARDLDFRSVYELKAIRTSP